ncbi:MAG: uridine diphosphate-N-acetylglucosamine-binding protein YvcK [Acidobacteria bacterium]|nr:uridine diphosphate-N-acetylglucosamine-binding protein YvcK [Acidobacteriota bacterium]
MNPRIVCVGGGHGLACALRAVRRVTESATAVVTVADDGGSSGILRRQLGIPAPGDLRMAIAALAGSEERSALLQYRFKDGELAGHPLGNLLIAALADLRGDFGRAVDEVAELAGARGRVLPVTTRPVALEATLAVDGGLEVRGQGAIARGPGPVARLRMEPPDAPATPQAVEAIEEADLVVLGPGSLFTSLIAVLIVPGIRHALAEAGRIALVLNLAEQAGETAGMDGASHVRALIEHCPGLRLDAVIAHEGSADVSRPVAVEPAAFAAMRAPLVMADLAAAGPEHDPDRLARVLRELLA